MATAVDRHLELIARRGVSDRRNGSGSRWLLTELGQIVHSVPRTRRFNPVHVVQAYARRAGHVERMVLACFVLGLSTRMVAKALSPVLAVTGAAAAEAQARREAKAVSVCLRHDEAVAKLGEQFGERQVGLAPLDPLRLDRLHHPERTR